MKGSKIQIICSLVLFVVFFIFNNVFAQQEKDMKKKIVIIKKTIDKDGNVNVEKTDKEGEDVGELLKEMEVTIGEDGKKEIRIMKTGKRSGAFFGVMVDPEEDGVQLLDVVKDSQSSSSQLQSISESS